MKKLLLVLAILLISSVPVSAGWVADESIFFDDEYGEMLKLDKPVDQMTWQEMRDKCISFKQEALADSLLEERGTPIKQLDIVLARVNTAIALNNETLAEINRRLAIVKKACYVAKKRQYERLGLKFTQSPPP